MTRSAERFTALARSALTALALSGACALAPPAARAASERASLHASFTPDTLGTPTTVSFAFSLSTTEGTAPPPLTAMDLQMPAGIGYARTTLGLALCDPAALLAKGPAGCPANSRLGYGSARVEVPFGTGAGREIPEVQAVAGPSTTGNMVVLFYASGLYPISAQLTFAGEVLPDSGRFGSQLLTNVPLVTSVPGGPDVSIVHVQATLGPSHLTYYRHSHGRLVPFTPRGVAVPERCPHGGFPFAAQFSFQDASHTSAATVVPCPRRAPKSSQGRPVSTATHTDNGRAALHSAEPAAAAVNRSPRTLDGAAASLDLCYVFAATVVRYLLAILPLASGELTHWQTRAAAIPDPKLRQSALQTLCKRGNIEGAALLATLAPAAQRRATVRALVALQTAYNYLDGLSELPSEDPTANADQLHRALPAALRPGAAHADYYAHNPQREDGGYLHALVEACRDALARLPSYATVAPFALAAAARVVDFQVAQPQRRARRAPRDAPLGHRRDSRGQRPPVVGDRGGRRQLTGGARPDRRGRGPSPRRLGGASNRRDLLPVGGSAALAARQPRRPRRGPPAGPAQPARLLQLAERSRDPPRAARGARQGPRRRPTEPARASRDRDRHVQLLPVGARVRHGRGADHHACALRRDGVAARSRDPHVSLQAALSHPHRAHLHLDDLLPACWRLRSRGSPRHHAGAP